LVPSRQGNDAPPETGTGTASAASVVADQRDVAAAKDEGPSKITDLNATDKAVGKQVIIVVSAALLLVVVLYFATTMSGGSQGDFSIAAPPPDQQTVEPLASQWQEQEGQLMSEIEGAAGEAQIDARRRLIDLYFAADRLDFAADQTVLIAEAIGSEEEWVLAGNLYFDWMQRAPDAQKAPWAQKAVGSYQAALELNPDNLDVRTDMAIAYLYDPQNSMMAIQETTRVLESDSLHIQANFNRGIMLNQINRTDQAIEQFEKVKRIIGDAEDPVYQRAESAIAQLSGS
jgi:tetratricopeptide (TPR) repeat protein